MPRINKNIIIGISIVVILIFGGIIGWVVFQKEKIPLEKEVIPEKEKTIGELLKDLTAPAGGEETKVSEKTLKNLTAPTDRYKSPEVPKEVLNSLTAPAQK